LKGLTPLHTSLGYAHGERMTEWEHNIGFKRGGEGKGGGREGREIVFFKYLRV